MYVQKVGSVQARQFQCDEGNVETRDDQSNWAYVCLRIYGLPIESSGDK